jgi:hypothetical protein
VTFYVTITDADAAAFWRRVVGQSDRVPVRSPDPVIANLPGFGATFAYLLDLEQLDDQQRSRLVDAIAERFRLPVNDVADAIDADGVPIRASVCFLPVRPRCEENQR